MRYQWRALVSVACLLIALRVEAAQRELKSETPEKLDAVLVLDASGSMLLTDPQRLRDQGAKLFTQFLKSDDRLAIVQFSQTASIVRPLTPYTKDQSESVAQDIQKIETLGTYTDLLSGIKLAKSLLEEGHREDANQIIILLSDGKMEPDPLFSTPSLLTGELLNGVLPDLKAKGIKIYTLAFSEQADKDLLASIALGTEGISWYTESAEKVHQSYADLFLAVKKPQIVPLTSKGFHVDESVQEATFYIARVEGQELELVSPSGKKLTAASKTTGLKWFKSEKFDVITIEAPEVGDWQIGGLPPEEGFATILTNLKLQTNWPATVTAEESFILEARLYDAEKPVVLPEVSGVTKYGFQITPTDQISAPIIKQFLIDDGKNGDKIAGDGIFSAKVEIESAGEYRLKVIAQSPTFTRNQQLPFRVKPPLITLSIVEREPEEILLKKAPEAGHGGGHGGGFAGEHDEHDGHAEEGAVHEGSPASETSAEKQEGKKEELREGRAGDYFVIELSEEASQLKNIEVKLIAIDPKRNRFNLPLTKVEGKVLRFELPASALPRDGEYELQAFISGTARNKKTLKGKTHIVRYQKIHIEGSNEVNLVIADEKPPEKEGLPWLGVLIVVAMNLTAGAVSFMLLKKAQGGSAEEIPDFPPPTGIQNVISDLQKRIEVSEVDLTEPLFTDPNYQIPTAGLAGASASAAASAAEATAPASEGAAETQPIPQEPPSDEEAH